MPYGPASLVVLLGVGLLLVIGALLMGAGRCKRTRTPPVAAPQDAVCDRCGERIRRLSAYCPRCGQTLRAL
jgi:hypothetical protein